MRYANKNMGVPINPYRHAEKSLWTEFWHDFVGIFAGADNPAISVILAVLFVAEWGLFLIGRLFRLNMKKPAIKK